MHSHEATQDMQPEALPPACARCEGFSCMCEYLGYCRWCEKPDQIMNAGPHEPCEACADYQEQEQERWRESVLTAPDSFHWFEKEI